MQLSPIIGTNNVRPIASLHVPLAAVCVPRDLAEGVMTAGLLFPGSTNCHRIELRTNAISAPDCPDIRRCGRIANVRLIRQSHTGRMAPINYHVN